MNLMNTDIFMKRFTGLSRLRCSQQLSSSPYIYRTYANMNAPSAAETDTQAEAVASTSGITTASLQKTLAEKLEAKHVDVEDMSGWSYTPNTKYPTD